MLEEFRRIGELMFREGLVDSHGGNMSIKKDDKIYITRRNAMLGDLKENDIVEGDDENASREIIVHRAIYKETKALAIVHTHSASAIAVSITDNKIIPQDSEGQYLYKSAAIVRAHQSIGSEEVARLLPTFLQPPNVVAVVKGHGAFAIGENLEEAYKYASSLENSCKVLIAIRSSGGQKPQVPPPRDNVRRQPDHRRSAIPPGIGVMDRSRYKR
ncbi:MAG: class II aldolase/adducin family protein [bacterium]